MTPFKLVVVYKDIEVSIVLKSAVDRAVRRWSDIIRGWKDGHNGYRIGRLTVRIVPLQNRTGPGETTAFTDPGKLKLMPKTAGAIAYLPREATIEVDLVDVDALTSTSQLSDMFTHEMGHALGLGTIWRAKKLVRGTGSNNPVYTGKYAIRQYKAIAGHNTLIPIPLERRGGPHSKECHWRQADFPREILTATLDREMWISKMTVGALEDLGYAVRLDQADTYDPARQGIKPPGN